MQCCWQLLQRAPVSQREREGNVFLRSVREPASCSAHTRAPPPHTLGPQSVLGCSPARVVLTSKTTECDLRPGCACSRTHTVYTLDAVQLPGQGKRRTRDFTRDAMRRFNLNNPLQCVLNGAQWFYVVSKYFLGYLYCLSLVYVTFARRATLMLLWGRICVKTWIRISLGESSLFWVGEMHSRIMCAPLTLGREKCVIVIVFRDNFAACISLWLVKRVVGIADTKVFVLECLLFYIYTNCLSL